MIWRQRKNKHVYFNGTGSVRSNAGHPPDSTLKSCEIGTMKTLKTTGGNSLSPGTPIRPNIPRPFPPLLPQTPNLLTRQPLILAIIPLPNRLRDLHPRLRPNRLLILGLSLLVPGQSLSTANLEKFEGSLGTGAGGNVARNQINQSVPIFTADSYLCW